MSKFTSPFHEPLPLVFVDFEPNAELNLAVRSTPPEPLGVNPMPPDGVLLPMVKLLPVKNRIALAVVVVLADAERLSQKRVVVVRAVVLLVGVVSPNVRAGIDGGVTHRG
jgi:hypothetical protein